MEEVSTFRYGKRMRGLKAELHLKEGMELKLGVKEAFEVEN